MKCAWDGVFELSAKDRSTKPRSTGFTMVIDKGLGLQRTQDLIDTAGHVIDDIKLTFGTSAFYGEDILKKKNEMLRQADIDIMPGGTFQEVSVWQGVYPEYLKRARELGFTAIEVSDGTIEMSAEVRKDCIKRALDAGFRAELEGMTNPYDAGESAADVIVQKLKLALDHPRLLDKTFNDLPAPEHRATE